MKKMFYVLSVGMLVGIAPAAMSQLITLPAPIQWDTQVDAISKPVIVRNDNGRWQSTVRYDVRDQTVYDSAGTVNRMGRLTGEMTIEISAAEVMTLTGHSTNDLFAPGEWEEHVYTAGFMKAMILSQAGAQRNQYETYWNQCIYAPTAVTQPTTDSLGNPILGWEDGLPIIGYTEDEIPEPILGELAQDANNVDIIGYWNGMPVIGYDPNGFPLFATME
jgi:hypothetical protein